MQVQRPLTEALRAGVRVEGGRERYRQRSAYPEA